MTSTGISPSCLPTPITQRELVSPLRGAGEARPQYRGGHQYSGASLGSSVSDEAWELEGTAGYSRESCTVALGANGSKMRAKRQYVDFAVTRFVRISISPA